VMMYMSERDARPVPPQISGIAMGGLVASVAAVLFLGVLPAPVIAWAERSIATIF
jgi:NADH:ubiquinone oxidoreductase subunit 2 (subunit N)